MKAPAFWYRPASLSAFALEPLAQAYKAGSKIRRFFAKPAKAPVPLICVGNVTAGGAGKTPTALAMGRLLKHEGAKPVFVSRGYGGHEKGPLLVDPRIHKAADVGDEPLLLAAYAPCWIGRDKVETIRAASASATHIILDDGMQNPTIAPDVALLVIDGTAGIGNGHVLPAGPLRETLEEAMARATAVIIVGKDEHLLTKRLTKPFFEARLLPHIGDDFPDLKPYFAFAGIARPEKFFASCHEVGLKLREMKSFPDHHAYTTEELESLVQGAEGKNLQLLTTMKDWVRLPDAFKPKVAALEVELTFRDPMGLLHTIQSSTLAARDPS